MDKTLVPNGRQVRILSVGVDPQALASRELILKSAGYQVLSISRTAHLPKSAIWSFDLVVLCHTLVESHADVVHTIWEERPAMPMLLVQASPRIDRYMDGVEVVGSTPEELLGAIARLTQPAKRKKPA